MHLSLDTTSEQHITLKLESCNEEECADRAEKPCTLMAGPVETLVVLVANVLEIEFEA